MVTGHDLSRAQIERHGRDRYPTAMSNAIKIMSEAAELVDAIDQSGIGNGTPPDFDGMPMIPPEVRRELADVGLSLYALANKLGLDLVQEMRELVETDTRDFR
jgi:NTP pyrophosphatase (non-canonical NTP hydrolase)